jgi:hypothetical protein
MRSSNSSPAAFDSGVSMQTIRIINRLAMAIT